MADYRKQKRFNPDTKVELRSVEEGFFGSWHIATVISADNLTRKVRYDSLLLDDGSDHVTDCVKVSAIVDGGDDFDHTPSDHRGTIRPLPPPLEINQSSLNYGQCVDMHEDEIWWEGVIFDHEDGSEERRIFFPDMGDERKVHIRSLRITQDWDELSDSWQPRGVWLFLEEIEKYCPLLVSMKQIWYDVRVKGSCDLKEWTSTDREKWKKWVSKVWCDNLKIIIKQILYEFNSEVLAQEGQTLLELPEPALDSVVTPAVKAREHLVADGWDLDFVFKRSNIGKGKRETCYCAPGEKLFCSLVKGCTWYKKNIGSVSDVVNPVEERRVIHVRDGLKGQLADKILVPKQSVKQRKVKDHGIRKAKKRKNAVIDIESHGTKHHKVDAVVLDHGRESGSSIQLAEGASALCTTRVLRSTKRIRLGDSPSHHMPRNVLSLLIENKVILPRLKVHCRGIDGRSVAEGTVTYYGIECICCECSFSISKFVVHAGINCDKPAANIFLEGGRSILDCQSQLMKDKKSRSSRMNSPILKRDGVIWENDHICSVCHCGGDLMLCDQCPSSFHMDCLGLKTLPEGDWFCPSCCCGICGKSSFDRNKEHVTNSMGRSCSQCDSWYHVGCLLAKGLVHTESNPVGKWFCNMQCEKIFQGLHQLLGRPTAVGNDNLIWTLVKHRETEDVNLVDNHAESSIETYSKLTVALDVMHECFEPLKEHLTHRDIVEDVMFCNRSHLNRLNFHGFYTVLLEKNDELVTVATIRVHGKKVAEVPLIATRFQYRRRGMCRMLMNELEKILGQLGVERLVLPAAPGVLDTWVKSFGFSKMNKSEQLNFLDYTFLNFQGTEMCQKVLNPVEGPINPSFSNIDTNDEMDLVGNSAAKDVYQADRVKESEHVDHGSAEAVGVSNSSENISSPAMFEQLKQQSDILVEVSDHHHHKAGEDNYNDGIICYERRKKSCPKKRTKSSISRCLNKTVMP